MKTNTVVSIIGLTAALIGIVLSLVLSLQKVPYMVALATSAASPTTCSLYTLKSRAEMGIPDNGSFSIAQTHPGGQNNWTQLTKLEIDYIKGLNVNSTKRWSWAAQPTGTLYLSINGYSTDDLVTWPNLVATSEDVNNRNEICISSNNSDGTANIVAIPQSADYQQFKNIEWLNQRIYGSYAGHPQLWIMPIWDPTSGFKVAKGNTYFAIDRAWLYQKIADIPIPWMQSITPTPTFISTITPTMEPPTATPTPGGSINVIVLNRGAGKYLSIRPGDTTSNVAVGFFYPGTEIPIYKIAENGSDYWGMDGNGYWVALILNGVQYTTWTP